MTDRRIRIILDKSGAVKDAKELEDALTGAGKSADTSQFKVRRLAAAIGAVTLAAGAAAGAIGVQLVRSGLAAIDTNEKLARSLNSTYDELRAVQIVAKDSGIDGLEASLAAMNQRLGRAESDGGRAVASLKALKLEASELSNLPLTERMAAIADAIRDSGMSAQEASGHLAMLGFTQANAVELFRNGGDAIRAARLEVDEYGLSVSSVDARQIEVANDAWSRIGRVVEVLRNRLTVALAPIIQYVANLINDAARESQGFESQISRAADSTIRGFTHVMDVVEGVRRAFLLVGQGAATLSIVIVKRMTEAAESIMAGPVNAVNVLIRTMNNIPGIEIQEVIQPAAVTTLRSRIAEMERAVDEGQRAMQETLMKPMPSSGLEERLQAIRDAAREAAEAVVAARTNMTAPEVPDATTDGPRGDNSRELTQMQQTTAALQRELDTRRATSQMYRDLEIDSMNNQFERERALSEIQQSERLAREENRFIEEQERNRDRFEQMLARTEYEEMERAMLEAEFEAQQLLRKETHEEALTAIEKDGADARRQIAQQEKMAKISVWQDMSSAGLQVLGAFADNSFKATKALGIAESSVSIVAGVAKALNNPYPANLGFAAQVATQGAGLISKLRSASMGGGGSAPTISTASPAAPAPQNMQPQESRQPNRVFRFENSGAPMSENMVEFVEEFAKFVSDDDRARVLISGRN